MLATLSEVKEILRITTNDNDVQITRILEAMDETVKSYLGWDVENGSHSSNIRNCDIVDSNLFTPFFGITSIDSINGESYTGVSGTDFFIQDNKIIVLDLYKYTSGQVFPYVQLTVIAGYATVPQSIKQALALLVGGELWKKNGSAVKKYTLGPRTVEFTETESDTNSQFTSVVSLLKPYKAYILKWA